MESNVRSYSYFRNHWVCQSVEVKWLTDDNDRK